MGWKLGVNDLPVGTLPFGLTLPVTLNLSPENLRSSVWEVIAHPGFIRSIRSRPQRQETPRREQYALMMGNDRISESTALSLLADQVQRTTAAFPPTARG